MSFRDQFLKAKEPAPEPPDTEFGRVFLRTMTAGEKDELESEHGKDGKLRARVVMACCCDEGGRLLFGPRDLAAIDDLPLSVVEPIFDAAVKVNRMLPKDREALRKNSETPSDDSTST
jgi:hypothetical protein